MSPSLSLNRQDIASILHFIIITYGTVLVAFSDQIQSGTMDPKILWSLFLSASLYALKKYMQGDASNPTISDNSVTPDMRVIDTPTASITDTPIDTTII